MYRHVQYMYIVYVHIATVMQCIPHVHVDVQCYYRCALSLVPRLPPLARNYCITLCECEFKKSCTSDIRYIIYIMSHVIRLKLTSRTVE